MRRGDYTGRDRRASEGYEAELSDFSTIESRWGYGKGALSCLAIVHSRRQPLGRSVNDEISYRHDQHA